ncbi:putative metallo-beta-lactamase domain protein [Nemania sp. NC0429]|nr:putative metallo-beta-lactamase domain protein [Nemania sp. NC0429]
MGVGGYQQINKAFNVCAFEDYLDTQLRGLPHLSNIEYLSPRVIRILGQNPGKFTLQGTNTYIVGTGPDRILIDTGQGIPEWADLLAKQLADANVSLSHVFLTHWHGDHTGGVPDVVRLYPSVANSIYKHTPSKDQKPIADGQVFQVEGATIHAVHAPGHSQDHTCFVLLEDNAMFTGDNVLGHGTSAVEDLGGWMASLRIMQSHRCTRGYPAHGAVIADLDGKISAELAYKMRREAQVLQALKTLKSRQNTATEAPGRSRATGSVTVSEVVTEIHGEELDNEVRLMALEPFIDEVLRKLAEDGAVAFEIRKGVKRWFVV